MSFRRITSALATGLVGALVATTAATVPLAEAQAPNVGQVPAGWEVSPEPVSSWGVATLMPSETVVFESLVWDFAEIDGVVYVGGKFGNVQQSNGAPLQGQSYLAAFDADTGAWIPSFNPTIDSGVFSLETDGTSLFVGGEFTTVNGVSTGPLAALDPATGALINTFDADLTFPAGTAVVMDLDIANGSLYAGGNFAFAGDDVAPRVAKLDLTTGAHDTTFGAAASGARVWTLELSPSGDRLYLGGYFEVLNGEPHKWFGAVDALTGELVPGVAQGTPEGMPNCCKQNPFDIAVHGDKVFVARESHLLEILNADDLSRVGYYLTSYGGGDYQAAEVIGERLYTGGHFWANQGYSTDVVEFNNAAWQAANQATLTDPSQTHVIWSAAFDANTGEEIQSYLMDMGMKSGIWAIHGSENGRLWLGGDVTRAGSGWAGGFATFDVAPVNERGSLLSLNQPATMSSTRDSFTANYAVDLALAGQTRHDGIRAWMAETLVEDDPWIEVDLGSVRQVGVVRLFERAVGNFNGMSNGTLYVSDVPFTSTDPDDTNAQAGVSSFDVGNIGRWTEVEVFRTARYVRYQLPGDSRQLTVDSLEVFEQVGDGPTLPAPATIRVTREEDRRVVINYGLVPGADTYEILRDGVVAGTDDNGWFVDIDLEPGTTYSYTARAIDAAGNPGDLSASVEATTTGGGSLPEPALLEVRRTEKRRIVVRYGKVPGAETHEILIDGTVVGTDNDGWYTALNLEPGTTYTIEVRGINGDVVGESATVTATTEGDVTELAEPAFLNVTRTEKRRVVVNYGKVPGAETHEILINGTVVGTDNDGWYTALNLDPATTYTIEVRGVAADGTEGPAASVDVTTLPN